MFATFSLSMPTMTSPISTSPFSVCVSPCKPAFAAAPQAFDLVITDQTMPRLTGEALVGEIRRIRPQMPIILCTGFSHTMTAAPATALDINAVVMKPLAIRDFSLLIRQVLDQSRRE